MRRAGFANRQHYDRFFQRYLFEDKQIMSFKIYYFNLCCFREYSFSK